jgi:hypothetical protein
MSRDLRPHYDVNGSPHMLLLSCLMGDRDMLRQRLGIGFLEIHQLEFSRYGRVSCFPR